MAGYSQHLKIQQQYDIRRREFLPPFSVMVGLGISAHVIFLLIWSFWPKQVEVQTPPRILSIRIGSNTPNITPTPVKEKQATAPVAKQETQSKKTNSATQMLEKLLDTNTRKPKKSKPKTNRRTSSQTNQTKRKQKTNKQPTTTQLPSAAGSSLGTQTNAPIQDIKRYTQQISAMVNSFVREIAVPTDIRNQLNRRKTYAVELLLVIGSNGQLVNHEVLRSSGYPMLDRVAIRSATKASPFPPPPPQYSGYGFKINISLD